jgi:hypothetical protein
MFSIWFEYDRSLIHFRGTTRVHYLASLIPSIFLLFRIVYFQLADGSQEQLDRSQLRLSAPITYY